MKIQAIKWNGMVKDVTFRCKYGTKTGQRFVCSEAHVNTISKYDFDGKVNEIKEVSIAVYDIVYANGSVLRVFNPIEVLFIK